MKKPYSKKVPARPATSKLQRSPDVMPSTAGASASDVAAMPEVPIAPLMDVPDDDDGVDEVDDEEDIFDQTIFRYTSRAQSRYVPRPTVALPPDVVPNSDQELRAFLRAAVKAESAPLPLADWLRERDDPRAAVVQDLCSAVPVLPDDALLGWHPFALVASPHWTATLENGRVVISTYPGNLLSGYLQAHGSDGAGKASLRRVGRTHAKIIAAFERCRLRLVLALFRLTEAELRPTETVSTADRVARLVRSLRGSRGRSVPQVCAEVAASPELGDPLVRALAESRTDNYLWQLVIDRLRPDWRRSVLLHPAT